MVKTIKISGKDYNMKSSAFTPFKYKNDFGTDFLKDISKIEKTYNGMKDLPKEQELEMLGEFNNILIVYLQIAYTMISEYDPQFKPFMEWLQELDTLVTGNKENDAWIEEVLQLAMSTFRG